MQRNVVPSTVEPDKEGKPHVLEQLIKLISDNRSLTRAERKKMREHLVGCLYCQAFLGEYLIESIEYDRVNSTSEIPARNLIAQLEKVMHQRLKEDIPAYVETVERSGEDEAYKHFSLLVSHFVDCQECRAEVEGLQSWLRQAIQKGLIEPFEANVRSRQ